MPDRDETRYRILDRRKEVKRDEKKDEPGRVGERGSFLGQNEGSDKGRSQNSMPQVKRVKIVNIAGSAMESTGG
jgi:hypothetical protein